MQVPTRKIVENRRALAGSKFWTGCCESGLILLDGTTICILCGIGKVKNDLTGRIRPV